MQEKNEIEHIDFNRIDGIEDAIGDVKLNAVFADAEKWMEINHATAEWKTFVRHPCYPECTMVVELVVTSKTGGASAYTAMGKVKRTITDDGKTPVSALSKLARYSVLIADFTQRRLGGPLPTPELEKIKIVEGWLGRKGFTNQDDYARSQGVSARTLRQWKKELEEQGKI
jgi:hypothetical protein